MKLTEKQIIYTKHALEKFKLLKERGWKITKSQIKSTLQKPKWKGKTKLGQFAAMSELDTKYILRVIYDKIGPNIKIITFHPARRGRYETKL